MLQGAELDELAFLRAQCGFYQRLLELNTKHEMRPLVEEAVALIVQVTGADQAYLELGTGDDDGSGFWLARGLSDEDVETVRARISRGIIAEALATGQTVRCASALADPRFHERGSVKRHAIRAVLCAPVGSTPPLGVVYLQGRSQPGAFTREDGACVEALARQLAPLAERLVQQHWTNRTRDHTAGIRAQFSCHAIIGRSAALAETLRQAALLAPLEVDVLLTGPSGTGKTALAQVIAANSKRSAGPFVELNCAALPEALLENELFGAARGAHSTALRAVPGKLAKAHGGTLFLDEIAELTPGSQAKLLQLIQSGLYYPLGATEPLQANVRVISATNVDLGRAVAERRFREDLFYRLHVMPITLPSLAERRDDIDLLIDHFIVSAGARHRLGTRSASAAALLACREAAWPGNVRQLMHAIEAAVIRAHGEGSSQVEPSHVFPEQSADGEAEVVSFQSATRAFQRRLVSEALEQHDWNVTAAARELGLTRSHIYNLIHAHGLSRAS